MRLANVRLKREAIFAARNAKKRLEAAKPTATAVIRIVAPKPED